MKNKHKLKINSCEKEIEVEEGENLLDAIKNAGIYVKSSCGGHGSCSDCLIKVLDGADQLNVLTFNEEQLLGNIFHITKERLACQVNIIGDISIDIVNGDLAKDQENILNKAKKSTIKVRKKNDVEKIYKERREAFLEKKNEKDSWQFHWTKDQKGRPKKLGGGKRPRPFRTPDEVDGEVLKKDEINSLREETAEKEHRKDEKMQNKRQNKCQDERQSEGRDFRKKRR